MSEASHGGTPEVLKSELVQPGETSTNSDRNASVSAGSGDSEDDYLASGGQFNADNRALLQTSISEAPLNERLPLMIELGDLEWRHGFFSEALKTSQRAWALAASASSIRQSPDSEVALTGLLDRLSRMGEREQLRHLVDSLEAEPLGGAASEAYIRAKSALWFHENQAEQNVFCGFTAANSVCVPLGFRPIYPDVHDPEEEREFIENGLSLYELRAHSLESDGDLQIFRRTDPAAPIPVPAVVHWRFGHYSAVVSEVAGRLRVKDVHLRVDTLMHPEAFESEFSGYLLTSASVEIPEGYERVPDEEAKTVFGSHCVHGRNDEGDEVSRGGSGGDGCPMGSWTFALLNPGVQINDTPISYQPPVGAGIAIRLEYDQRSTVIEDQPSHGNFGPRWTHNYSTYIELTGSNGGGSFFNLFDFGNTFDGASTSVNVVFGNGQYYTYSYDEALGEYTSREQERPRLFWSEDDQQFTLKYLDGSSMVYATPDSAAPTRYYVTKYLDPQGNAITLNYDAQLRLISIEDSLAQTTVFSYTPATGDGVPGDTTKIRSITDPFGRTAEFRYTGAGQLYQIIDPIGIVSEFTYAPETDFIDALTTPYGSTTFTWGDLPGINEEPGRFVEAVNAQGDRDRERAEANDYAEYPAGGVSPLPAPGAVNVDGEAISFLPKLTNMHYRNTYFWDRQQMRYGRDDYSKATIYNWQAVNDVITSTLASLKQPLENRIWYNYPGQVSAEGVGNSNQPSKIVRAVEDRDGRTTWTMTQNEYHPVTGKMTRTVDPLGRETIYEYNPEGSASGAVEGIDLTAIKAKVGETFETLATFSDYVGHQPQTIADAAGQLTQITYNAAGQVLTETGPHGAVTRYSYDSDGYLQSIDGPLPGDADTISFTYDAAGRVKTVTDFDSYTVSYEYDAIDRLTRVVYPDGTDEVYLYENLDLIAFIDRLDRATTYEYDALRQLVAVTDPEGRTVGYNWCDCGDLSGLVDPMGRVTTWHRDIMGRVTAKEYVDGSRERFEYEPGSGRLSQRIDEKGQITRYRYNVDGTLHATLYPNAANPTPTVTYTYDADYRRVTGMADGIGQTTTTYHPVGSLGANQVAAVDGPWVNDTVTYAYDALGRVASRAIDGVAQTPSYDAASRLQSVTNPLGSFAYTYDGPSGRLASVEHGGGTRMEYAYFGNNNDNRLQQIRNLGAGGTVVSAFNYNYDAIGRITAWTQQLGSSAALARTWTLGYDDADQLTSADLSGGGQPDTSHAWSYDPAANRLAQTVDGETTAYNYNALNQLDYSSLEAPEATYEWDAEDRLIAVNQGNLRTEFRYDGQGRRVGVIEKDDGAVVSEVTYLWCGLEICEQRDATGATVLQRYYAQGMVDLNGGSQNYLFTYDHLGSIREVLNPSSGAVAERLAYDAWGNASRTAGSAVTPFTYTGHFTNATTGLVLAPYRAYDPEDGRWISRDPIGESGGLNLYGYVGNRPASHYDPLGLKEDSISDMFFDSLSESAKSINPFTIGKNKKGKLRPKLKKGISPLDVPKFGYNLIDKFAGKVSDKTGISKSAIIDAGVNWDPKIPFSYIPEANNEGFRESGIGPSLQYRNAMRDFHEQQVEQARREGRSYIPEPIGFTSSDCD